MVCHSKGPGGGRIMASLRIQNLQAVPPWCGVEGPCGWGQKQWPVPSSFRKCLRCPRKEQTPRARYRGVLGIGHGEQRQQFLTVGQRCAAVAAGDTLPARAAGVLDEGVLLAGLGRAAIGAVDRQQAPQHEADLLAPAAGQGTVWQARDATHQLCGHEVVALVGGLVQLERQAARAALFEA